MSPYDYKPSFPWSELPHEWTSPPLVTTTVWCWPDAMDLADSKPPTDKGYVASFKLPKPSSPSLFLPKAQTKPDLVFLRGINSCRFEFKSSPSLAW
jgi:hypothetical protein